MVQILVSASVKYQKSLFARLVMGSIVFFAIAGLYTAWTDSWSPFYQYTLLVHAIGGLIFIVPFFIYGSLHVRETGIRARMILLYALAGLGVMVSTLLTLIPGMIFFGIFLAWSPIRFWRKKVVSEKYGLAESVTLATGLILITTMIIMASTGIMIIGGPACYPGGRPFFTVHTLAAYAFIISLPIHLGAAWASPKTEPRLSIERRKKMFPGVVALAIFIVIGFFAANYKPEPSPKRGAQKSLAEKPQPPFGKTSFVLEDDQSFFPELIGNSHGCGGIQCHDTIVQQWLFSKHATTATSTTYRNALEKIIQAYGERSADGCDCCHAPAAMISNVRNFSPKVSYNEPTYDGVSCNVCHLVTGVKKESESRYSYQYAKPLKPYLYQYAKPGTFQRRIYELTIHCKPSHHRALYNRPKVFRSREYCLVCHPMSDASVRNDQYVTIRDIGCNVCHMYYFDRNYWGDLVRDHKYKIRFSGANPIHWDPSFFEDQQRMAEGRNKPARVYPDFAVLHPDRFH